MTTTTLEQAIQSTKGVLAGIKHSDLGAATPCASWKVCDIINHVVGAQFFFAAIASGEPMSGDTPPDFASGDFMDAFEQGTKSSVAAFGADGAMQRTVHMPIGDVPGSFAVVVAATDTFVHGWDLARATGQSTDLAPELAAGLLAGIRATDLPPELRGPDTKALFGPEQAAPEGSSNADQLAAFLGREV